jgi:hypothetical protein
MPQPVLSDRRLAAKKSAAKRLGIPIENYLEKINLNFKWCSVCQSWVTMDNFNQNRNALDGKDKICRECRRLADKSRYKQVEQRKLRSKPPRDGDKKQARNTVGSAVRCGKIPPAITLPCFDCGHIGGDRKHEYDHYKGYAGTNHLDVQCVCVPCHAKREKQRQSLVQDFIRSEPSTDC